MIVLVRVAVEVIVVVDAEVEYCAEARRGRMAVVRSEKRILKMVRLICEDWIVFEEVDMYRDR